jgi:hypothetical protein
VKKKKKNSQRHCCLSPLFFFFLFMDTFVTSQQQASDRTVTVAHELLHDIASCHYYRPLAASAAAPLRSSSITAATAEHDFPAVQGTSSIADTKDPKDDDEDDPLFSDDRPTPLLSSSTITTEQHATVMTIKHGGKNRKRVLFKPEPEPEQEPEPESETERGEPTVAAALDEKNKLAPSVITQTILPSTSFSSHHMATTTTTTTTTTPAATATKSSVAGLVQTSGWQLLREPQASAVAAQRRAVAGDTFTTAKALVLQLLPEDYSVMRDTEGAIHFVTDINVDAASVHAGLFFEPSDAMFKATEWAKTLFSAIPRGPNGKINYLKAHPDELWPTSLMTRQHRAKRAKLASGSSSQVDADEDKDNDDAAEEQEQEQEQMQVDGQHQHQNQNGSAPAVAAAAPTQSLLVMQRYKDEAGDRNKCLWKDYADTVLMEQQARLAASGVSAVAPASTTAKPKAKPKAKAAAKPAAATAAAKPAKPAAPVVEEAITSSPLAKAFAKTAPKASASAKAAAKAAAAAVLAHPPPETKTPPAKRQAVAPDAAAAAAAAAKKPKVKSNVLVTDWFSNAFAMIDTAYLNGTVENTDKLLARAKAKNPELFVRLPSNTSPNAWKDYEHFRAFVLPIAIEVYRNFVAPLDTLPSRLPVPQQPVGDWFDQAIRMVLNLRNANGTKARDALLAESRVANPKLFERIEPGTDAANALMSCKDYTDFVLPITIEMYRRCYLPLYARRQQQ